MGRDDEYVLYAELPGMKLNDMHIRFHEEMLTMQGERKLKHETHNGYYHRERASGAFSRSFMIGPAAEADQVEAKYTYGMLTITIPKAAEARSRRSAIQTA
jgi:HSP20 family protein